MTKSHPQLATRLCFARSQRLLNATQYSQVFDNAPIRASNQHVLILSRPNDCGYARLGIIVAKKNIRLAVERNRFKRSSREAFRSKQHQLPAIDAIVLARRGADSLSNSELSHTFNGLWKRIIKQAAKYENS